MKSNHHDYINYIVVTSILS